jgi:hypothetical protein
VFSGVVGGPNLKATEVEIMDLSLRLLILALRAESVRRRLHAGAFGPAL